MHNVSPNPASTGGRSLLAAASLTLALVVTASGCTTHTAHAAGAQAADITSTPPLPSLAAAPSPTPVATASPRPSRSATPAQTGHKSGPNKPPRVISATISPREIEVCIPGAPLVRPVVTARVSDPDDAVSTLTVTLTYSAGLSYGGVVTMKYDASRGVFTYRLPPVEGKSVGQAGSLGAGIAVHDRAGNVPRPTIIAASLDICLPPIKNG